MSSLKPHKKFILRIFFLLLFVSCKNSSPNTIEVDSSRVSQATPTLIASEVSATTAIPSIVLERAQYAGLSPEEVMSFYYQIENAIANHDPVALAGLVHYPISECGRSQGEKFESPDDLISSYHKIFSRYDDSVSPPSNPEELIINWKGVCAQSYCFSGFCDDEECEEITIQLVRLGDYCSFRSRAPVGKGFTLSQEVIIDQTSFNFGKYKVVSIESVGGSLLTPDQVNKFEYVTIFPDQYVTVDGCYFGCSCDSLEYEFNPPLYDKGRALWYGIPAIGELIMLCDDGHRSYFDILTETSLGYYYDGYYFTLQFVEE